MGIAQTSIQTDELPPKVKKAYSSLC